MSTNYRDIIKKAIETLEQATAEDKAHNYKVAVQHYMSGAERLMHAVKYEAMNDRMKQLIRTKVASYLKRAEELENILKNRPGEENAVADGEPGRGNARDDDDKADPERKRVMQKFEGAIAVDTGVSFDNVIGLEKAKESLKEAIILPMKFPQLFQRNRRRCSGILLYGPPGTGKSYLAKAIATECKSTFISVSSSDLLPRWSDENIKRVKCLFELARERQPFVVFIDEIDALCEQRNDTESESSRRVKTEFLIQMQDVETDSSGVLVLAATNAPWALDAAFRRRFEKRIYISLPEVNERAAMFKTHLDTTTHYEINENEWMELAQRTEHYSGADIGVVCREALMRPIRQLSLATHFKRVQNPRSDGPRQVWFPCSPVDPDSEELTLNQIQPEEFCEPPMTMADMLAALVTQKPTISETDLLLHNKFRQEFGEEDS